jgi:hypothetical protein
MLSVSMLSVGTLSIVMSSRSYIFLLNKASVFRQMSKINGVEISDVPVGRIGRSLNGFRAMHRSWTNFS